MFKELIEAIRAGVAVQKIDGYYSRPVYHQPDNSLPVAIQTGTLQSVVDFLGKPGLFVHVASPTEVSVFGMLEGNQQRPEYLRATSPIEQFRFHQYQPAEMFLVSLLSLFEDSPNRAKLLQVVGNLRDEVIKTQVDDGVTQVATVRQGVARVAEVEIQNPIQLIPIRTFIEIKQPASDFVFRMRKGAQGVECALFEADGGKWKIAAIDNIRQWLADRTEVGIIG